MKHQVTDLTRKYHDLEVEYRRLENEREELASAYKEAEAVSCQTPTHAFHRF